MKIKTVIITIHGQESIGKNLEILSSKLIKEDNMDNCIVINLRYTKLWTIVNTLPWVRTMTAKYIASRLNTITNYQYKDAKIIIIAHSNGTRATRIAMDMRSKPEKKWPMFRVDDLILLGCPIKRNYDWSNHYDTQVMNFVSTNDRVVWWARFYGMGGAGRWGFDYEPENLQQVYVKWGHSGFMEKGYSLISNYIKSIMREHDRF